MYIYIGFTFGLCCARYSFLLTIDQTNAARTQLARFFCKATFIYNEGKDELANFFVCTRNGKRLWTFYPIRVYKNQALIISWLLHTYYKEVVASGSILMGDHPSKNPAVCYLRSLWSTSRGNLRLDSDVVVVLFPRPFHHVKTADASRKWRRLNDILPLPSSNKSNLLHWYEEEDGGEEDGRTVDTDFYGI